MLGKAVHAVNIYFDIYFDILCVLKMKEGETCFQFLAARCLLNELN
jgi:hypothetical protein